MRFLVYIETRKTHVTVTVDADSAPEAASLAVGSLRRDDMIYKNTVRVISIHDMKEYPV